MWTRKIANEAHTIGLICWAISIFFVSMLVTETSGLIVQSALFPACTCSDKDAPTSSVDFVVFIHGRLEADSSVENIRIPRPSVLYSEFCKGLAKTKNVLLPEYHEHYSEWRREPRELCLGPVSSAVGEAIRNHASGSFVATGRRGNNNPPVKVTLVSFSMGAAILLKLLENESILSSQEVEIEKVVLVEPVWRCWLPFAVSRSVEARYSTTSRDKDLTVSNAPALAIVGTNDEEVQHDSGGGCKNSVARSLRPFLSNLTVIDIEGGNHFGLCSGVAEFAEDGLPVSMSPNDLREEIIGHISEFCGW